MKIREASLILIACLTLATGIAAAQQPKNPCNPCKKKAGNPCNPCAKKAGNPCNPCAKKAGNPCNPCAKKASKEVEDAIYRALSKRFDESPQESRTRRQLNDELESRMDEDAVSAESNVSLNETRVEVEDPEDFDIASPLVAARRFLRDESPNPLMEGDCRAQAAQRAYAHWVGKTGSDEGFDAHAELWKEKIISEDGINFSAYLAHIAECKVHCGPLVREIMNCHILAVSRLDHNLVLFDYNSADLRAQENAVLQQAADELARDPALKALLIGRASKLTESGNADYNKVLAGRRALAVQDRLMEFGIARSRINFLAIGWEEPHIGEVVAQTYGYEELYQQEGIDSVNQSVNIVLYDSSQGGHDH